MRTKDSNMDKKLHGLVYGMALLLLTACGDGKVEEQISDEIKSADKAVAEPIAKPVTKPSEAKVVAEVIETKIVDGILSSYVTKKVAAHTYVIHGPLEMPNKANGGFMNNPAFIITEKSVVIVDPGSSTIAGRELVKRVKEITDKPITHVVNTHVHGDHWLGNGGIKESFPDATFYAHPKMIEKAKAGEADHWINLMMQLTENKTVGTKAVIPDQALENLQEIKIDDLIIKVHLSEKAHSTTDAMFEVVEDKVLFTGDNITNKRIPRMTDGSFVGNIAVANYALELPVEVVVPGHGPTGGKEVLSAYGKYLSTVYETSKVLAEEGLETYEMKEQLLEKLTDYSDWTRLEDQLGKHIGQSVLEAEEAGF